MALTRVTNNGLDPNDEFSFGGLNVTGVVTANNFSGDGSNLTGIDAASIQSGNSNVQVVDTGSDGHVKAKTEGTERVRITAAGDVGIGITNPTAKLDVVNDNTNDEEVLRVRGSHGNSGGVVGKTHIGLHYFNASGIDDFSPVRITAEEAAAGSYNANLVFSTRNSGGDDAPTERVRITDAGDVGIGTINPIGTAALTGNTATLAVGVATVSDLYVNGNVYPSAGALSNRNLIINGSMQIAQRGTSSTTSGYGSVDRWHADYGSGTVTQSQESLTSGDPYDEGFRNFLRATNTSASSAPTTEFWRAIQYIEGYNIASSGWNYKSSSSYITLCFWVRSSLAGTYYGKVQTFDGTTYSYPFSFTLIADTWTKVTKTIPGNSNLTIDNDNGSGLGVYIVSYYGTDNTSSGVSLNTWAAFSAGSQFPDYAQNWKGTASATFDLTGVQVEVGEKATSFEHRSFGDELDRCQRYYCKSYNYTTSPGTATGEGAMYGRIYGTSNVSNNPVQVQFPSTMRTGATVAIYSTNGTEGSVSDCSTGYTHGSDNAATFTGTIGATGFSKMTGNNIGANNIFGFQYTADAEL